MSSVGAPTRSTGQLQLVLPGGKAKTVPWLVDAPAGHLGTTAVCLNHGAGGDATSGHLPMLAAACAQAGMPCLRFTSRGGNLQHRVDVCKAVLLQAHSLPALANVEQFVMAGTSMGARVACSVAQEQQAQQGLAQQQARQEPTQQQEQHEQHEGSAKQRGKRKQQQGEQQQQQQEKQQVEKLPPVVACMLFSYPLHPPGMPEQLRDALLTQVDQPALLVRGTKDPFSQAGLWEATLARMQSVRWRQHIVEGGDHSLRVSGGGKKAGGDKKAGSGGNGGGSSAGGSNEAALEGVCAEVQRFLKEVAGGVLQQQQQQKKKKKKKPQAPGAAAAPSRPPRAAQMQPKQQSKQQPKQQPEQRAAGNKRKAAAQEPACKEGGNASKQGGRKRGRAH